MPYFKYYEMISRSDYYIFVYSLKIYNKSIKTDCLSNQFRLVKLFFTCLLIAYKDILRFFIINAINFIMPTRKTAILSPI